MIEKQRVLHVIGKFINVSGSIIIFIAGFLNWTKNRSSYELIELYIPNGWYLLLTGAIISLSSITVSIFVERTKMKLLFIQIIGISMILFVYLVVTSNFSDFTNQWMSGYYLCALGLIICVFEIFMSIFNTLNFDSTESAKKEELTESIKQLEKKFFESLNHEVRREILRMIGKKGVSSFKEFKEKLAIGTGTLYHHIKFLSGLIYQEKDKKYYLTKLGELTLRFMKDNKPYLENIGSTLQNAGGNKPKQRKLVERLNPAVYFKKLIPHDKQKLTRYLAIPISFIVAGCLMGFENRLIFFVWRSDATEYYLFKLPTYLLLGFISWFVIWGIIEIAAYINFKKKGEYLRSMMGIGISILPILIYEIISFTISLVTQIPEVIAGILLVLAQMFTLYLMISFIMTQKDLKIEKAVSVVLPAHYISLFFNILFFLFF
ncbi:MAG: winged helix-turn-helix domain-containing protein [Promethearchaeota archaeon]